MGIFDNKPGGIFGNDPGKNADKDRGDFSDVSSDTSSTAGRSSPPADFSDVTSGASSTAESTTNQTYTVKSGDSLSKIAKRIYGDANEWHRIYEANRDKIKDPDLIHPGQEFTIPGA
ncbi:MAG TPA: LysM peptidoglycan-binding domain-containing protein [Gemmatimonadaceae bacterium]|nr:LysM peptidoglycan-binding domain-containing protein [Gemmatimonadaceae bacterium]